ncbi:pyruvate formate lyase activating enzyme [Paenibacillus sophorae]|uniref:Pyruvate formate lyase activating enzyme n=1 Tax=Paenibacillus sophorae TaxID=1333845 RepID=A0A1H8V868_9BACL|nr:radical SAM protein [Paenibacillus sophorae]QWU13255.1 radical SAM protein [Paenibacillus sophorae]SEP11606.1 pyruvate formate lyase activating enzyme [Paenibacillus sophorae]
MITSNASACIRDIQKHSTQDGSGTQTVVHLKGCPLYCTWCPNPELRNPGVRLLWDPVRTRHFEDGRIYSVQEVMELCLDNPDSYGKTANGVMLTGGEAMMQHSFVYELLSRLKERGVHTAVETTGYVTETQFAKVVPLIGHLIFYLKHYEREAHRKITGVYNDLIIENLRNSLLSPSEVEVRLTLIPGLNDRPEDAEGFARLLQRIGVKQAQLPPFINQAAPSGRHNAPDNASPLSEMELTGYQDALQSHHMDCS